MTAKDIISPQIIPISAVSGRNDGPYSESKAVKASAPLSLVLEHMASGAEVVPVVDDDTGERLGAVVGLRAAHHIKIKQVRIGILHGVGYGRSAVHAWRTGHHKLRIFIKLRKQRCGARQPHHDTYKGQSFAR